MNKSLNGGDTREARIKKNTANLAYWTGTWLVTMAVAAFGPTFLWHEDTLLTALAVAVNLAVGIGMILANIRYLQGLDELQKKVTLEAMALALGVTLVGGLSYSLLDTTGLISQHAEIAFLVILTSITYLVAIIVGNRRYK
jgi:hypothetical protein